MPGLNNPVPIPPSTKEQLLSTTQKLVKAAESIRDMLFKVISVLDGYPPTRLVDAQGNVFNTLAAKVGFVALPYSPPTPFRVLIRTNPSNPALFQAMVTDGDLLLSLKPNDNMTITGLDTWFDLIANDVIALYIVVSDYTAVSATIQSYGQGTTTFDPTLAAWDSGDNSYVFDDGGTPSKQIGINILIAYSTPKGDGSPYLVQAQFDHLLLENCDIEGQPAIYDFSHRERYGITAP